MEEQRIIVEDEPSGSTEIQRTRGETAAITKQQRKQQKEDQNKDKVMMVSGIVGM
jgi:hypothetical protein